MRGIENFVLHTAVRKKHRELAVAVLQHAGLEISSWPPTAEQLKSDAYISEHHNVVYRKSPIELAEPLFGINTIYLCESYGSLDHGDEEYTKLVRSRPSYRGSVRDLKHSVDRPTQILDVSADESELNHKDFAMIFLTPEEPPFAVHDDDIQYAWGHVHDRGGHGLDLRLLPVLNELFEGNYRQELTDAQSLLLSRAVARSEASFSIERYL